MNPLDPSAVPPATDGVLTSPQRAVVVEDDADILNLVCFKLGRAGFKTRAESLGPRGLDAVLEEVPDVVVLDLMLPGLNGLEICRVIRDHPRTKSVPVVLLTARARERDIEQGFAAGADDYIVKPFSPSELLSRVQAAVNRGHRAR